jgi:hypothetical protein
MKMLCTFTDPLNCLCLHFAFHSAWVRFDKIAGYWLGLDTPKYHWAILEHQRRLKEEEDAILREESTIMKAAMVRLFSSENLFSTIM